MKFGIFYEHQLPRPWDDGAEQKLFQEGQWVWLFTRHRPSSGPEAHQPLGGALCHYEEGQRRPLHYHSPRVHGQAHP